MVIAAHQALDWVQRLVGLSIALQAAELLALRTQWSDQGVWRWSTLRLDFSSWPKPIRGLLDAALAQQRFLFLQFLQLNIAIFVMVSAADTWLVWLPMLIMSMLSSLRFRGSFNGGSDTMTLVSLTALTAYSFSTQSRFAAILCLGYIALQTTLSYFTAGVLKAKQASWRNGRALRYFIEASSYGTPRSIKQVSGTYPRAMTLVAWSLLAFELSFPVVFVTPRAALPVLAVGVLFHVANFATFGLNRFVFAWFATYPAVLFFALRLH